MSGNPTHLVCSTLWRDTAMTKNKCINVRHNHPVIGKYFSLDMGSFCSPSRHRRDARGATLETRDMSTGLAMAVVSCR